MRKNQNYTVEFRAESVELGTDQNLSHQEAAARLGSPKGLLSNWVQTVKRQGKRVGGSDAMPPTVGELQGKVARGAGCPLVSKAPRTGASSACSRSSRAWMYSGQLPKLRCTRTQKRRSPRPVAGPFIR